MKKEILDFLGSEEKTFPEIINHLDKKGMKASGSGTLNFQNSIDKIIWLKISKEFKQALVELAAQKKIKLIRVDVSFYLNRVNLKETSIYSIYSKEYKGFLEWIPIAVKRDSYIEGVSPRENQKRY